MNELPHCLLLCFMPALATVIGVCSDPFSFLFSVAGLVCHVPYLIQHLNVVRHLFPVKVIAEAAS